MKNYHHSKLQKMLLSSLFCLHYYQDLNLRTCAQILNISAATATRRLQQAQEKLKLELERS